MHVLCVCVCVRVCVLILVSSLVALQQQPRLGVTRDLKRQTQTDMGWAVNSDGDTPAAAWRLQRVYYIQHEGGSGLAKLSRGSV